MKSFKSYIIEAKKSSTSWDSNRVYRVDPVGRENVFQRYDYAVLGKDGKDVGTAPLSQNHNVKPGDEMHGHDVHAVKKMAFATPGRPNAFYAAFGRKAGPNGTPVQGAAVYDEDKMFGKNYDPSYKGTIHTTEEALKSMPKSVAVHSAHGDGFKTESFSGKEEVTSEHPAKDVQHEGNLNTHVLLKNQYNIVVHPNVKSIKRTLEQIKKKSPNLSILDQT